MPPVVGRRYWVPCVRAFGMLWPVNGPSHADADLGVPEEHLHCDARFLSERQVQHNLDVMFAATAAVADASWFPEAPGFTREQVLELVRRSPAAATLASALALQVKNLRPPTLHLRVCKREAFEAGIGWFLPQLERQHATAHAVDCRVCPHRGTPLSSLPVDSDGGVVCPAHGLRWSKTMGSLMPRTRPHRLATPEAAHEYREALRSVDAKKPGVAPRPAGPTSALSRS